MKKKAKNKKKFLKARIQKELKKNSVDDRPKKEEETEPQEYTEVNQFMQEQEQENIFEKEIMDNLHYLNACLMNNKKTELRTIFNFSDGSLLSKDEINLTFLKELLDAFYLANGADKYGSAVRENIYDHLLKIMDVKPENLGGNFITCTVAAPIEIQVLTGLYKLFYNNFLQSYCCGYGFINSKKINIVDWQRDFYEYCKNSSIWKFTHLMVNNNE